MKPSTFINEEQLISKAVQVLIERLGVVEANRFLSLASQERIESVKRHQLWQQKLDKDQFFDEVFDQS